MARLDRDALLTAITAALSATPDPEGVADLVASRGRINVAATAAEIGPAIKRLTPLQGYRWLAINAGDLFTASPLTMSTKVGILDPTGRVLKAADLPRPNDRDERDLRRLSRATEGAEPHARLERVREGRRKRRAQWSTRGGRRSGACE